MQHHIRWRSRPNVAKLEQNIDQLRTTVIKLRRDLTNKSGYAAKFEAVLRSRTERIDELANTVATLRDQNRRLDEEAERLAQMVRLA